MGALFSDEWLSACNDALAGVVVPSSLGRLVVTELLTDSPPGRHPAITLLADTDGVRLEAGEHDDTIAWLTVSMADADALHAGSLDPAQALIEGRVRIRGDFRAVVDAMGLLAAAHDALRARTTSD